MGKRWWTKSLSVAVVSGLMLIALACTPWEVERVNDALSSTVPTSDSVASAPTTEPVRPTPIPSTGSSTRTPEPIRSVPTTTPLPQSTPTPVVDQRPSLPTVDPDATAAPTSAPEPTQTPVPTAVPVPEHYYRTTQEAETAALDLGCTGYSFVRFGEAGYYRPCGSDDSFDVAVNNVPTNLTGGRCELDSNPDIRFSAAPTDLSMIDSIVPSGSPSGGVIKPHSYLHNSDSGDNTNVRVPVYAVVDSKVSSISYYKEGSSAPEYLIFFDVSCEISFKFDHLSELIPSLTELAPTTPAETTHTTEVTPLEFKAGDLIGYSIGAGGRGAWDFGAYDTTHTNSFANQERYEEQFMSQSIHAFCPYDYYTSPLREQMKALFGTHDRKPASFPCTTTERDVLGSAAGAWFAHQDYSGPPDSDLAIAMLPGDYVAITGLNGDIRIRNGESTWLEPALLTTSHCYSGNSRWVYLEVTAEGTQMEVATGNGGCPSSLPGNSTTYYR